MNFNERGITVGDLLIIIIIILTTTVVIKNFKKDDQTSLNQFHQKDILLIIDSNKLL